VWEDMTLGNVHDARVYHSINFEVEIRKAEKKRGSLGRSFTSNSLEKTWSYVTFRQGELNVEGAGTDKRGWLVSQKKEKNDREPV